MLSADLLKEARLRVGITQAELGRRVKRSQSQVARWERGELHMRDMTAKYITMVCTPMKRKGKK